MGPPDVTVALVMVPPVFVGVRVVTAPTVSVIVRALTTGMASFKKIVRDWTVQAPTPLQSCRSST